MLRDESAVAETRDELVAGYELRPDEQPVPTDIERARPQMTGSQLESAEQAIAALRLASHAKGVMTLSVALRVKTWTWGRLSAEVDLPPVSEPVLV